MRNVLIPTKLNAVAAERLTDAGFQVVQDTKIDFPELVKTHPETTALIVRSEKVTSEIIDALPNLRVVVRAGAGYNTIDIKHARRKGVDVMNTPGANSNAVAEEVVALALAAYRHILPADASVRSGKWEKSQFMGREITGKTIGIVGLGNIGRLVIRRLSGFENNIIGYDPVISTSRAEALGVTLCNLEELFTQADIVTLHIPETDETRGLINRALLEKMKPNAVLINCARAGVINEEDLRAVKAERNLLFCNDVYAADKPGDKSVADIADIMMPHLGASTQEANYNAASRAAEQIIAYFDRGITTYVVNRAVPEGLDEQYQLLAFQLTRVARQYLGEHVQPKHIETSFYGGLNEYSQWLLASIVLGLSQEFDPLFDYQDAEAYLKDKGVTYVNREVDERKGYGKSMTIDLCQGQGRSLTRVSVRGTFAEGRPMVARINNFDHLYFDPRGASVITEYQDRPGVIAGITTTLARHGINIEDIRGPHDVKSGNSIAICKVNQPIDRPICDEITRDVSAQKTVAIYLK